ncbi:MAG: DMT family transporter, partial [candidate division WOR-3 bacterium]
FCLEALLLRKRNWVLFTLMVLIWGSNWVVMKVGLRFVSPLNLVMQRLLLASIALLPVIVWRQKSLPRDRFTWLKLVMLSLINATSMISTNIGLLNEASGLSSLITYTQPLFVFCLAVPFLGEKISATRILGVVSGFLGVAALYAARLRTQINISSPFLFLILGAFFWAITVIYYKKFLNYVDPAIVNMVQFPIGAILLLSIASTLEGLTFSDNMLYILSILYMSVLGSALASTIWLTLMREEETTVVSTSSLIVPAIALIFGLVFLGEVIEQISLLGFALILIGIYLVNKSHK